MQKKLQGLLNRDGRYFARLVIPKPLRPFLGNKTELREALGPDRAAAKIALHGAMARLQAQIAVAEQNLKTSTGELPKPGRYPLPVEQIASRHYHDRLSADTEARNSSSAWASVGIDDIYVSLLRQGLAGTLTDDTLETIIGSRIRLYQALGNTTAERGTDEWRALARALCEAELEALGRVAERDEGDFTGQPARPHLLEALPDPEPAPPISTFNKLTFEDIIQEKERLTAMKLSGHTLSAATLKKYRQAVHEFEHFRRDKRAATVTLEDAERWRDAMLTGGKFSGKTVLDKLAAIRAVLAWGQQQQKGKLFPAGMPFQHLQLPTVEATDSADKTYTLEQARKVLIAARGDTRPAAAKDSA